MVPRQLVRWHLTTVALVAGLGSSASAQDRITPEDFLARVNGKTVSFHRQSTGEIVGVEQFLSPRLSVWRGAENKCVYGEITTPDGLLCFLYRDLGQTEPVCWSVYDVDGTLVSLGVGDIFGAVLVAQFDDRDLGCPETPLS